jgi:hypothetical protein
MAAQYRAPSRYRGQVRQLGEEGGYGRNGPPALMFNGYEFGDVQAFVAPVH